MSARPMPDPSWLRERAPSMRWKRSNRRGSSSSAMPVPVSATSRQRVVVIHRSAHGDRPLERELEGVREQVEDDLLPHVAIDVDGLGQRRAVDDEREPGALDRRAKAAREVDGERGEVDRLVDGLDAAGLDARELEQRVDELEQAQRVALEELDGRVIDRARPAGMASMSWMGASISVSGVRNSWLTLLKNAVFARSSSASASARSFSCSKERACSMRPALALATRRRKSR